MSSAALFFDSSVSFSGLPLDRRIFKSLARQRLVYPSLIQAKVIPIALRGTDILVKARTGAGKTLSYCIPIVQNLLVHISSLAAIGSTASATATVKSSKARKSGVAAIIIVPSKELCDQVKKTVDQLLYYCQELLSAVSLTPDAPKAIQLPLLKDEPEIIISTPGRLAEFLKSGDIVLKQSLQMMVIDEADLLLSYGYESEIRDILDYLPTFKQTLMMSATLTPEVEKIKSVVLHNPITIKLEESTRIDGECLSQYYLNSSMKDKYLIIYSLLQLKLLSGKILFYTNSNEISFRLKLFLELFSIRCAVLNGNLPFNSRNNIIQQFNRGVFDYLIATDESNGEIQEEIQSQSMNDEINEENEEEIKNKLIGAQVLVESNEENDENYSKSDSAAASSSLPASLKRQEFSSSRGIDFQDVSVVVNFDFPVSVKSYIHRVGRTARAGKLGTALSLVAPSEESYLQAVLDYQTRESAAVQLNPSAALKCLAFNMSDIEGFRYRVEDVSRAVTGAAVKEAQLKDIKLELINSEKLRAHFEDNPRELDLLKHDKVLRPARVQPHLKSVPDYLLPAGIQINSATGMPLAQISAKGNSTRQKRKTFTKQSAANPAQRKKIRAAEDPLRAFGGALKSKSSAAAAVAGPSAAPRQSLSSIKVGFNESSAGRNRWKEAHLTGKGTQKKNRKKSGI